MKRIIKNIFEIILYLIIFFVGSNIIFLLSFFNYFHSWKTASNNQTYVWINRDADFTWNGDTKADFAHGKGTISYSYGTAKDVELYYGIEKELYKSLGNTDCKYAGEYNYKLIKGLGFTKIPDGRGVVYSPEEQVYAGIFKNGEISNGYHFVNDELQYEGSFLDGKYSGSGKYYENNKIVYEGTWVTIHHKKFTKNGHYPLFNEIQM